MMEFEIDFYAVLGIPADADQKAIKRAYRQLARRFHPDRNHDEESEQRFHEIQQAYEILMDPVRREAYDHWREQQGWDRPLPIVLRVTPSQRMLPCMGESQALYVLVELLPSPEIESERLPLNLCLVLDRSTSMKGGRLQQVKEAARHIVDQLQKEDVLSLVAFDDRAEVLLEGRRNVDAASARAAISQIQAGGGTEILQGLHLGWQQIQRWHSPESVSHLLLLTDGQTYGDEEGCLEMARLAAQEQVSLTLMGVGSDWNDQLLDEMAELSGPTSMSVYVDSTSKIVKAFEDRIRDLGSIFARDLVLSLHLSKGTALKQAFLVAPHITPLQFVEEQVQLGSLQKENPQAAILELLVPSREPGEHRLAQLDLEAVVPGMGDQPVRTRHSLVMPCNTSLGQHTHVPPDIVSAMGKLTIYKMQQRAMADLEQGLVEPAVARFKAIATRLLDIGEVELARAALLEAGRLSQTGSLSPTGRKRIRYGTRGLTIVPKEVRND
jgi:Ca-activated chloride channel family protein